MREPGIYLKTHDGNFINPSYTYEKGELSRHQEIVAIDKDGSEFKLYVKGGRVRVAGYQHGQLIIVPVVSNVVRLGRIKNE